MEEASLRHFVYDPLVSGYDATFWKTLAGTPATSSGKLRLSATGATKATQTLTLTGAITPGTHAQSVLTSTGTAPGDGEVVVIGATTYTFKTTLTGAANEVKIGTAAVTLDNLKSAINATAGAGTTYGTGTVANATVVATTNTDTEQTVVARVPGTAANTADTTTDAATLSWPDTTLGGGTGASDPGVASETVTIGTKVYSFVDVLSETNGAAAIANQVLFGANSAAALDNLKLAINGGATAGTNYSTGTVAHTQVTATTNGDTSQVVQAILGGTAANTIATTETIVNGEWGAATLENGADDGAPCEIATYGSFRYGEIEFAVNVPTAPTAGDSRVWGVFVPNGGNVDRAEFVISDATFSVVAYDRDGDALLNQTIAWDSNWTAAEVKFALRWTQNAIKFLVADSIKAVYSTTGETEDTDTVDGPVQAHMKNGSTTSTPTDNLDVGAIKFRNVQSYS